MAADHVTDADWERLMCGEMGAAERDRTLAHVMSCTDCRTIHRSLLEVQREAAAMERPAPANAGTTYRVWTIAGSLAAAAAVVMAVLIPWPSAGPSAGDVTRSNPASAEVVVVAPAARSVLSSRRFSWQPVAGADTYEIRVNGEDGSRVWSVTVAENNATLPDGVALTPGAYYWQVTAQKQKATLAASPLIPFRVE